MNPDLKSLSRGLLATSIGLSLVLLAVSAGLAHWGDSVLPGVARTIAEVAMEQGARCEAAGDLEGARAHYEQALAGTFQGEANRNHCEKRLGVVLYRLSRYDDALFRLETAQSSPLHSLNGYGPLVDTLIELERWQDAQTTAERWVKESTDDASNRADGLCALGRIALHEGRLTDATEHFQAALSLQPVHEADGYLAEVYATQGETEKARDTLTTYLASAPWNEKTRAQWKRLESWVR